MATQKSNFEKPKLDKKVSGSFTKEEEELSLESEKSDHSAKIANVGLSKDVEMVPDRVEEIKA